MLKIGIVGSSSLVKNSAELIRQVDGCEYLGFYDQDKPKDSSFQHADLNDLMTKADAFCVLDPIYNADLAERLIKNQKHCLIDSPFAPSSDAANYFVNLVREADVKIHVSNPDRHNDAFHNTYPYFENPVFIESHRLNTYSKETKALPLVMNLMIHDLDIILNVVKSAVKSVSATGVAVVSKEADIVNARIEFENGCIANLTASRISPSSEHKISFYQDSNFINVDYLHKNSKVYQLNSKAKKSLNNVFSFEAGSGALANNEIAYFANSINSDTQNISIANCLKALEIAYAIQEKVDRSIPIR